MQLLQEYPRECRTDFNVHPHSVRCTVSNTQPISPRGLLTPGKTADGSFPFLGLESALSAIPEVFQQQTKPHQQNSVESVPVSSRNSLAVGGTASLVNAVAPADKASLVNDVAALGKGEMHPASAAYALNMRQHMLNQAYRNATASGQPAGGAVGGVGAHALLGRQAAPSAGPFDAGHGGHHGNSGVLMGSHCMHTLMTDNYTTCINDRLGHG